MLTQIQDYIENIGYSIRDFINNLDVKLICYGIFILIVFHIISMIIVFSPLNNIVWLNVIGKICSCIIGILALITLLINILNLGDADRGILCILSMIILIVEIIRILYIFGIYNKGRLKCTSILQIINLLILLFLSSIIKWLHKPL